MKLCNSTFGPAAEGREAIRGSLLPWVIHCGCPQRGPKSPNLRGCLSFLSRMEIFYLSKTVSKVVLVISYQGPSTVLQKAHLRPFSSASEICFQGSSASVLNGDHVRMICPDILEERLKDSLVLDLHVLLQNAEPAQHCLQVPPGQHRLNNISPAKSC